MRPVFVLLFFDAILLITAIVFTMESLREKEPRAPWIGLVGVMILMGMALLIIYIPSLRIPTAIGFGLAILIFLICLFPTKPNQRALKGALGYVADDFKRFDERDIVFARNRSLPPDSEVYRRYYALHPEKEKKDAERRAKGGPVGKIGSIDKGYRPIVSMIAAHFKLPVILGPYAQADPDSGSTRVEIHPMKMAKIVKGFAKHLGADLVGICKVNPKWTYSHRGEIFYNNWEDWGRKIPEPLSFAVVIATEMDHKNVGAGPHSPALFESASNYALGAYITTVLAKWFASMGYRAVAQHSRHYDMQMVPLAIDAGLGELGRFGYLIAKKYGPRVRLFSTTTDMPLVPDKPVDLGVEGFCERCLKCADACPSKSISDGDKTIFNGVDKWKLNEEACFNYWGKVGTDCSICMGICPFSRPNRNIHRLVKWILRHSSFAQKVFPYIDNFVYGKKWHPRSVPEWISYSGSET